MSFLPEAAAIQLMLLYFKIGASICITGRVSHLCCGFSWIRMLP